MDIQEKIKSFASRILTMKESIQTEEATKTSLVMPFFQIMGYDVFNPLEFTPEYTADVGIKKGEKVDYAILKDNKPTILIECKAVNEKLEKHDSQLFRYFGTSTAKFAILTNGIVYRFYSDIEESNKMDEAPFLEVDLLNIKDYVLRELTKFTKDSFDEEKIFSSAAELKYMNQIRQVIKEEMQDPSDDFVRLVLSRDIYEGVKTQNVVERFHPLVKQAFTLILNEMINDRLKNALSENDNKKDEEESDELEPIIESNDVGSKIITTEEEIEAYNVIKAILRKDVPGKRITYKDTVPYFSVTLDGKPTRWICRLYIKERIKYMTVMLEKEVRRFDFEEIEDLYNFEDVLRTRLAELMQ